MTRAGVYRHPPQPTQLRQPRRFPPPAPPEPEQQAGTLIGWYDAQKETSYSADAQVGTATDFSGNGNHATQATGGFQPLYRVAGINGQASFDFDGSDDRLATAAFGTPDAQPNTIVIVVKLDSVATAQNMVDGVTSGARNAIYMMSSPLDWALYGGTGGPQGGTPDTNPHIIRALFDGANSTLWVDDVLIGTASGGTHACGGLTLGSDFSGAASRLNGHLGAVLAYAGDISATWTPLRDHLLDKWAFSAGQTGAVNQVTETDTAQLTTRLKTKVPAQVAETDIAQTITRVKARVLGQVVETTTAQLITRAKVKLADQSSETDTSQLVARTKARVLGRTTEADTARTITEAGGITAIVGQAVETDIAQAVGRLKSRVVGQVAETDSAQIVSELKARVVGQAVETDVAQPVLRIKTKTIGINFTDNYFDEYGDSEEQNIAQTLGKLKTRIIGQATQADVAQVIVSGIRTGTQLHLTTIAAESGVTAGSGTRHRFHWDAGASSTIRNKNTVAGPTVPLQDTDSSTAGTDGNPVSWYSNQLEAVTIAGSITIELWAEESGG